MSLTRSRASALRWGVAGYGDVVTGRALPALRACGLPVTAIWGRNPARVRAVARRWQVPVATIVFDRLLAEVDLVYVATPVVAHLPLAGAALAAGRHVLVEKPVAGTLRADSAGHAERLGDLADARGLRIGVAYYRRLAPYLPPMIAAIGAGRIHRATATFRRPFDPAADHPMRWRTFRALSGGGVLADAGSHRLDLLCRLLGKPSVLRARLADRFPGGAERSAEVRLDWPSGARADIDTRWAAGPAADRISCHLEGARITVDPLDSGRIVRRTGLRRQTTTVTMPSNPHAALFTDFAESVVTGDPPACPWSAGLLVDRLIAAAELSSERNGRPVALT